MRTIEDNKLIAEFMELETPDGIYFEHLTKKGDRELSHFMLLEYHLSWDWLMPVVQVIKDNDKDGLGYNYIDAIDFALADGLLDGVYETVVQFIKWYNENK